MYLATSSDLKSVKDSSTVQFINKLILVIKAIEFININYWALSDPESIPDDSTTPDDEKKKAISDRNEYLSTSKLLKWAVQTFCGVYFFFASRAYEIKEEKSIV